MLLIHALLAFQDSKVSHTLGRIHNASSRAISTCMSCQPSPSGQTPKVKALKGWQETFYKPLYGEGWALQATAAGCVEGRGILHAGGHSVPAPQSWWDKLISETSKGHLGTYMTLLVSDLFSTATTGLSPPVCSELFSKAFISPAGPFLLGLSSLSWLSSFSLCENCSG